MSPESPPSAAFAEEPELAPATAPAPVLPVRRQLQDFPDWLGPMLVKELRQGMRSAGFVWTFGIVEICLAGMAFSAMLSENADGAYAPFWWGVCIVICLLMPLRAFSSLHDEIRLQTIDTLILTRQSAWRIASGKWLSLMGLALIFAVTVAPYAVVWYFSGGINPLTEVIRLGVVLSAGAVFCAMTLAISWVRQYFVRSLFLILILWLAFTWCRYFMTGVTVSGGSESMDLLSWLEAARMGSVSFSNTGWLARTVRVLLTAWVIFFCLDLGASVLAPLAENRATRRRLFGAVMIALLLTVWIWLPDMRRAGVIAAVAIAITTGLQAMGEPLGGISVQVQPFVRKGRAGRLASVWFCPGWPSGAFYWAVCGIACLAAWIAFWTFSLYPAGGVSPPARSWHSGSGGVIIMPAAAGPTWQSEELAKRSIQGIALAGAVALTFVLARLFSRWRACNGVLITMCAVIVTGMHFMAGLSIKGEEGGTARWLTFLNPLAGFSAVRWPHEEEYWLLTSAPPEAWPGPLPSEISALQLQTISRGALRKKGLDEAVVERSGIRDPGTLAAVAGLSVRRFVRPSDFVPVLQASLISSGAWTALALVFAVRGFRQVSQAWREAAARMAAEKPAATAGV